MKKVMVIFYVAVSIITALEAVAALYALACSESMWVIIALGAICGGIIAYALGGKVFKDLLAEEEDYEE